MHMYEGFREATELVERRWIKNRWADEHGGMCVGHSLVVAFGGRGDIGTRMIPGDVRDAVDAKLMRRSPYYRYLRKRGDYIQDAIINWNDAPWRRKSHVVSLLEALTHDHEVQYLRWRVETLQAELAKLRDENTLADLEKELAWSWERLTCLTN